MYATPPSPSWVVGGGLSDKRPGEGSAFPVSRSNRAIPRTLRTGKHSNDPSSAPRSPLPSLVGACRRLPYPVISDDQPDPVEEEKKKKEEEEEEVVAAAVA